MSLQSWPLVSAALVMGAGGSLHCVLMCSPLQRIAIHGRSGHPDPSPIPVGFSTPMATPASRPPPDSAAADPGFGPVHRRPVPNGASAGRSQRPELAFHLGRIVGYGAAGALVGQSSEWLMLAATQNAVLHQVWLGLLLLSLLLGLLLLCFGRLPIDLSALGRWVPLPFMTAPVGDAPPPVSLAHSTARAPAGPQQTCSSTSGHCETPCSRAQGAAGAVSAAFPRPAWRHSRFLRGLPWVALPCGLLWSALALAVLAGSPWGGAAVMLAFGLATSAGLWLTHRLFSRLARWGRQRWSLQEGLVHRLSGGMLMLMSAIALVAVSTGMPNPFC